MKMKQLCAACVAGLLITISACTVRDQSALDGQRLKGWEKLMLRQDVELNVGDAAPDFTLKTLDGRGAVTLSDSRGQQPVVLIFGSYT